MAIRPRRAGGGGLCHHGRLLTGCGTDPNDDFRPRRLNRHAALVARARISARFRAVCRPQRRGRGAVHGRRRAGRGPQSRSHRPAHRHRDRIGHHLRLAGTRSGAHLRTVRRHNSFRTAGVAARRIRRADDRARDRHLGFATSRLPNCRPASSSRTACASRNRSRARPGIRWRGCGTRASRIC